MKKNKDIFIKKYPVITAIFIVFILLVTIVICVNYKQQKLFSQNLKQLSNDISYYRTYLDEADISTFEKRFNILESKYIDVLAAKETINFWLLILSLLIPITLGYAIYQKNRMIDQAENEVKEVRKMRDEGSKEMRDELNSIINTKGDLIELVNKMKGELGELNSKYKRDIKKLVKEELKHIEDKSQDNIDLIDKESEKQRRISELLVKGIDYGKNKETYELSIKEFEKILDIEPDYSLAYYNIACAYSLLKNVNNAIKYLRKALDKGHFAIEYYKQTLFKGDADFDNIRKTKEFKDFIQDVKDKYGDK